MITDAEAAFTSICLEGFFYGKLSVACFTLYPCYIKNVQSLPGLGLYTGIFVIYLQCPWNKSRTPIILYALCTLYVLTTATFISDFVTLILKVSNDFICKNIIFFNELCRFLSVHNRFNYKLTHSPCYFAFI